MTGADLYDDWPDTDYEGRSGCAGILAALAVCAVIYGVAALIILWLLR